MRVLIPKALIPKARLQIRKTGLPLAHTALVAAPLLKLQLWLAISTCITSLLIHACTSTLPLLLKPKCILSNQNLGLVIKITKLVTAVGAAGDQDFQPVGTMPVKNPKISFF